MGDVGRWANPILPGRLVTLRPYTVDDTDAAWEMVNDSEGNDLTNTTASFTVDEIGEWCATRNAQDERLDLVIVENATGLYAGEAVLNDYEPADESANFRIALRGPAWFGRGLGTEATQLIVDYGFATVGLRTVTLEVLARNPRAIRIYEKAGFRRTAVSAEGGETWVAMAITAC